MAGKTKYHVCFRVGRVVPWEKAILFGNMIAEAPIFIDYLKKTRGFFLPTGPGQPERDWWDEGPLTERATSYRAILAARKHGLKQSQLDELSRGKIPDFLTYRGLSALQLKFNTLGPGTRHEFYEIKPRSDYWIVEGGKKVRALTKAYGEKGLPYEAGSLYPTHFYPPDGIAELPLQMLDKLHETEWFDKREIIKKRAKLNKAELVLEVRPAPKVVGLLLYRICIKLEADENDDRTDFAVIHTARELVNAFVMSVVEKQPKEIEWEVSAVGRTLDVVLLETPRGRNDSLVPGNHPPVLYPMRQLELVTGPQLLRTSLKDVRDAVNTRRIGLPGDKLMLCCDEVF